MDVAVDIGVLSITAAEYTSGDVAVGRLCGFYQATHGAAVEGHGGVARHITVNIAAAIDTGDDPTVLHDDGGVAHDAIVKGFNVVTAAVEVADLAVEIIQRHNGASVDSSGIAAAEDATGDLGHIVVAVDASGVFHVGQRGHGGGVVADIDTGVGRNDSRRTFTATEDVATDTCRLVDVHHIDGGRGGAGVGGGIGSQIAATIYIINIKGAGAFVIKHVDGDVARDVAVDVRAAEGILVDGAAVEVQGDATVNVGSDGIGTLRATVDVLHGASLEVKDHVAGDVGSVGTAVDVGEGAGAALDGRGDVGGDVNLVRAAEEVGDHLGTAAIVVDVDVDGAADGALGVTAADEGSDGAAVDGEVDTAGADIGCRHLTVTAAEHIVEAAALQVDRGAGDSSGIAAAEDAADGVVTAEDIDRGHLAGNGVVGVLAAAEDIGDGIAGIGQRVHTRSVGRAVDVHGHLLLR